MRICMVGTGYVGLVSGACFAEFGVSVTCVDKDAEKIERLRRGEIPIYEPGLDVVVQANTRAGRLTFSTDLAAAVRESDAVFIAVGTPSRRGDGFADLSYVEAAAREIGEAISRYTVVVTKSTVPVGTGRRVEAIIAEVCPRDSFDVVSNPEFLREGSAVQDFMRPDRVVIGAESPRARAVMEALYRPLYLLETPIVMTSLETAEVTKYAANAFLATKISFINEIANLCERCGADVQDVAKGIGLDGRIGKKFLHAGPGYGGSCFPKDTKALAVTGRMFGAPQRIVETVIDVNEGRKREMADRVIAACGGSVEGARVAVLGVSFKPNTDDMRDAPSLDIIPALQAAGAEVHAYDPASMYEAQRLLPGVHWAADAYGVLEQADALVILTEWNEFRALALDRVKTAMRRPLVLDLRNVYRPDEMARAGLVYYSIGRNPVNGPPLPAPATTAASNGAPAHAAGV